MSMALTRTCICLVVTFVLYFLTDAAQEPKGSEKKRDDKPTSIVGTWEAEDRHLAMGTLYQPLHRTRLRHSTVTFKQDGDRLTGYSLTPEGEGLSGDKEWPDGRTEFRTVTFADGRLVFEFDIKEVAHGWGLGVKSKGTVRVEAKLQGDRLVGKWGLFLKDGSEPFRGEWEAVRTKEPLQPGYKVDESLQLYFREYRVTGPQVDKPGEGSYLVCTYSTRPVVMVYTREINAPVIRLIKKLDEATGTHHKERLGSYVVLLRDLLDREAELKALAEKEKVRHTLLAMAVPHQRFQARFGAEAETTVILATSQRRVKASYAYRKGELTDKAIEQILADLPKILPKKD